MEFLVKIKNKYEIIAILREHIKHKGRVVKREEHSKKDIELKSINYDYITIHDKENEFSEGAFSCEMYCSLGLVILELKKEKKSQRERATSDIICKIPRKITIIQRRRYPRVYFNEESNYTGTGRFKNGIMYQFMIKDISDGGCALVTDRKGIESDAILRHVKLDFREFGNFTTTLKVQKVTEEENIIRLSCQFLFRDNEEKSKAEKLVIRLNLTQRKRRY